MLKNWKIWVPTVLVLGALLWWTAVGLKKQVLIRSDGEVLVADQIWVVDRKVYYIRGVKMAWVEYTPGQRIIQGSFIEPSSYAPLLTVHFRNSLEKYTGIALPDTLFHQPLTGFFQKGLRFGARNAGYFALAILLFFCVKHGRRFFNKKIRRTGDSDALRSGYHPPLAGIADVEALFLELFREKIGAPFEAPSEIVVLTNYVPGAKRVVELKIKHEGNWRARRMTISPIGENTGSKSQCFYVIFDTHMVVKIPPRPINNFEEYTDLVRSEAKIMRKLAPRVCVIPNFSVILKKTRIYHGAGNMAADNLEEEYIRWLKLSANYQRFLKVGDSFVFFMDLARYFFLSHVADGFHRADQVVENEVSADAGFLVDSNQFEAKYGAPGREFWPDINRLYENFKNELSDDIIHSSETAYLSEWHIQIWFLSHLAGLDAKAITLKVGGKIDEYLTQQLNSLGDKRIEIGSRYRQLIKYHTRDRLFFRNRPLMEAMATNLLELLAWLENKRVAMRDLKPDNLLVAGDPSNYPHFLKSAKSYTIGLIDLETAVDFSGSSHLTMPQPQLGGTPLYGTPSHFLTNTLLRDFHKDLSLIFFLQDWHAVIAIIFEVITGEKLFTRSAREIRNLIHQMLQTASEKGGLKAAYVQNAQAFWQSAEIELNNRIQAALAQLDAVYIIIPENIKNRLLDHLTQERSDIEHRIMECLESNDAFGGENNRSILFKSTVENLERFCAKHQGQKSSEPLIRGLEDLIELKQIQEKKIQQALQIGRSYPKVTARLLLETMFAVVSMQMQPDVAEIDKQLFSPPHTTDDEGADTTIETVLADESSRGLGYSVTVAIG